MKKKSKILIIGGNGFLGSSFIKRILNEKFIIFSISLSKKSLYRNKKNLRYLQCDLTKQKDLNKLSKFKFNYIINFGGYIDHVPFTDKKSQEIFKSHFSSIINLLNTINLSELKHFIQIGSSDEYGMVESPQTEEKNGLPFSPYGLSKLFLTNYLMSYYENCKVPVTILRLFIVYGPNQKKNRLIPYVISNCLKDKLFEVSKGDQVRDFTYIDDIVEAIYLTLNNKKAFGAIINLTSNNPIKVKEIIKLINKKIGKGSPKFDTKNLKIENKYLFSPNLKAKKILRWKPKFKLDVGLSETIKYYENE